MPTLSGEKLNARFEALRRAMRESDVGLVAVTPGADLAYLTGHFAHPSERPVLLFVSVNEQPVMVVAAFESRALPDLGDRVRVITYGETDNPYEVTSFALSGAVWTTVAVSDVAWARVLLGLQRMLPQATFISAANLFRTLRMRKDADEVATLCEAGRRTDEAFEELLRLPFLGRTEVEIASSLERLLKDRGLRSASAIVASGPNGASPHHHASERIVENGDVIVIDCGGTLEGYYSDITRTVVVGLPTDEVSAAYDVVRRAQESATSAVHPGVRCEAIDQAARAVIDQAGLGEAFIHRTGHGVGLEGHEEPYLVQGNSMPIEAGMVFSIEPGVYLDGRFGIRVEDTVVVTETVAESFNHVTHDLISVS